jgi:hypothetical protein
MLSWNRSRSPPLRRGVRGPAVVVEACSRQPDPTLPGKTTTGRSKPAFSAGAAGKLRMSTTMEPRYKDRRAGSKYDDGRRSRRGADVSRNLLVPEHAMCPGHAIDRPNRAHPSLLRSAIALIGCGPGVPSNFPASALHPGSGKNPIPTSFPIRRSKQH